MAPAGLVMAAGVLAAGASMGGFLGRFWWWFDLLSHFRVQYFLGLTVIAILLALFRKKRAALIFGVFALLNLILTLPLYFGRDGDVQGDAKTFRALLINVNTANRQYNRVKKFISETDADFIVVEEINSIWLEHLKELSNSYHHVEARTREDNFGIGMFSKHSFSRSGIVYIGSADVPSVFGEFEIEGKRIFVLGTHPLPPGSAEYSRYRNNQLAEIPRVLNDFSCPIILLGDLNVTPWCHYFRKLLRDSGLKNSGAGWGIQPTWPTYFLPLRIPIDHCLVSSGITITGRKIGPHLGSDHYPVIVDCAY